MNRQRFHQPARSFSATACFTGRVRKAQVSGGPTPTLVCALKLLLVVFGDAVKFVNLPVTLSNRLTYFVQTVRRDRYGNIVTGVSFK